MDHVYLTGPQGTTIDVGSWIDLSRGGPDYGARDLVQAQYAQNSLAEGGVFAYETEPIRRMLFPLTVPSGGVGGNSLDTIESLLHLCARPGGYVDIQPDGTPTANMTRFDVVGGRVNHDPYTVPVQRAARRFLSLGLDVQPYGYWPTWITLASVNTAGAVVAPTRFLISAASIIGDAPGLAQLVVQATAPPLASGPGGSYYLGYMAWSIAGHPSLQKSPISSASSSTLTFVSDAYASGIAGPTVAQLGFPIGTSPGFFGGLNGAFPVPNYNLIVAGPTYAVMRGRFRIYAWMKLTPTGAMPVQVSVDAYPDGIYHPLASANPIATVIPAVGSGASSALGSWGIQAGGAYTMYDLGEVVFPRTPEASGYENTVAALRFWAQYPSAAATAQLNIAAAWCLPLGGPAGIMPRGFGIPTDGAGVASITNRIDLDGGRRTAALKLRSGGVEDLKVDGGVEPVIRSALGEYRGVFPLVGASDTQLNMLVETRPYGMVNAGPLIHGTSAPKIAYSLSYRPRFRFLRGL